MDTPLPTPQKPKKNNRSRMNRMLYRILAQHAMCSCGASVSWSANVNSRCSSCRVWTTLCREKRWSLKNSKNGSWPASPKRCSSHRLTEYSSFRLAHIVRVASYASSVVFFFGIELFFLVFSLFFVAFIVMTNDKCHRTRNVRLRVLCSRVEVDSICGSIFSFLFFLADDSVITSAASALQVNDEQSHELRSSPPVTRFC